MSYFATDKIIQTKLFFPKIIFQKIWTNFGWQTVSYNRSSTLWWWWLRWVLILRVTWGVHGVTKQSGKDNRKYIDGGNEGAYNRTS